MKKIFDLHHSLKIKSQWLSLLIFPTLLMVPLLTSGTDKAVVHFRGEINEKSATELVESLFRKIDEGSHSLTLFLESRGGDIREASKIAFFLEELDVTTVNLKDCSSACTIVFAAGKRRLARSNAKFTFHGVTLSEDDSNFRLPENVRNQVIRNYAATWTQSINKVSPPLAKELTDNDVLLSGNLVLRGKKLINYSFVTELID